MHLNAVAQWDQWWVRWVSSESGRKWHISLERGERVTDRPLAVQTSLGTMLNMKNSPEIGTRNEDKSTINMLHRRSLPNMARLHIIDVGSCPFVQVMMTLLLLFVKKQLCLIIQSCWTQLFMMLSSAILIKTIIYHFIDSKCVWKQGLFSRCHSLSVELSLVPC